MENQNKFPAAVVPLPQAVEGPGSDECTCTHHCLVPLQAAAMEQQLRGTYFDFPCFNIQPHDSDQGINWLDPNCLCVWWKGASVI